MRGSAIINLGDYSTPRFSGRSSLPAIRKGEHRGGDITQGIAASPGDSGSVRAFVDCGGFPSANSPGKPGNNEDAAESLFPTESGAFGREFDTGNFKRQALPLL